MGFSQGEEPTLREIGASPAVGGAGNVDSAVAAFQDGTRCIQTDLELNEDRQPLEALVEKRTAELQAANRSLQLRVEWLEAVNLINQMVIRLPEFGIGVGYKGYEAEIYEKIVDLVNKLIVVKNSFIAEWDAFGRQFTILAHSCHSCDLAIHANLTGSLINLPEAVLFEIKKGNQAMISHNQLSEMEGVLASHIQKSELRSIFLVPLQMREQLCGFLGLEMQEIGRSITREESNLLSIFSTDIARLIEGTRLLEQVKNLSVQEERNRLARDLHDSVTQVLFSAALVAEVIPQIWRRDPDRALQSLEKLQRLTRGALAEMRTMLLELRPSAVIQTPLSELLAQLTEAVTSRSGLPFQLFIEQIPPLPEEVHMNFYHIAQEALNNVVKHSQAQHVVVRLTASPLPLDANGKPGYDVKLVIQDDGVGFYAESERASHLGLNIMRERAAAIQAALTLESEPGYGTLVSLTWCSGLRMEG
jgi:signal transduction histidine kinase